jgi:CubicO group peptidase (beta-lactamase class C family)
MFRTTLIALAAAVSVAALAGSASALPGPTSPPIGASPSLTRIFRGDDGGALYLRQLGNKVYGFGEHPGRHYAYVVSGLISGDRITGSWRDVPKGTRRDNGSLSFRVSQLGAKLTRTGGGDLGPETFAGISPLAIPWANSQTAGFQELSDTDLDGAFVDPDDNRYYVRETSSAVVSVAEQNFQPDGRPDWVTVFDGKRNANGSLSGTWVDVPKGLFTRSGTFSGTVVAGKREVKLVQGLSRKRLKPNYAIDWNTFRDQIATSLNGKAVGYAFAITHLGSVVRSGAGGARRHRIDGVRKPFTVNTVAQTASTAKTINAAALIKALHERGLTVEAKVAPFLPSCWEKGKDVGTMTFRQLLNHTSGLPMGSGCDADPYACLVKMIKEGRTQPRTYAYNTHAYDLLRFLVPMVDDLAAGTAWFDGWECKNTGGILNNKMSERFVRYILHELLDPIGVDASFYGDPAVSDVALNYDFNNGKGVTLEGEAPRLDFFERAGSGKMMISAPEYAQFLSALERGEIIPKQLVEQMHGTSNDRLGFDGTYGGNAGSYFVKGGRCHAFDSPKVRKCQTMAIVFPSDIQAYVTVNSTNNTYSGGLNGVLGRAFDAALKS